MSQHTSTVTEKGQVTIPIEMRRALGLKPRDRVEFELVNGGVRLLPAKSTLLAGYGAVQPRERPEDFQRIRREVEEEMAEACIEET